MSFEKTNWRRFASDPPHDVLKRFQVPVLSYRYTGHFPHLPTLDVRMIQWSNGAWSWWTTGANILPEFMPTHWAEVTPPEPGYPVECKEQIDQSILDPIAETAKRYRKIIDWSEEDQCFYGSAPPLIDKCCKADNEADVLAQLCLLLEKGIAAYLANGKTLPPSTLDAKEQERPTKRRRRKYRRRQLMESKTDSPVIAPLEGAVPQYSVFLVVVAYLGIGNRLFIRGEGPGLSWDKGVPLRFVSIGKWTWGANSTTQIKIKLYKNDEIESTNLGVLTLEPGQPLEVAPQF